MEKLECRKNSWVMSPFGGPRDQSVTQKTKRERAVPPLGLPIFVKVQSGLAPLPSQSCLLKAVFVQKIPFSSTSEHHVPHGGLWVWSLSTNSSQFTTVWTVNKAHAAALCSQTLSITHTFVSVTLGPASVCSKAICHHFAELTGFTVLSLWVRRKAATLHQTVGHSQAEKGWQKKWETACL